MYLFLTFETVQKQQKKKKQVQNINLIEEYLKNVTNTTKFVIAALLEKQQQRTSKL